MSLPTTIKQWTTDQDGLENIKLGEAPMPMPGKGEVLVKISAVAINYRVSDNMATCKVGFENIQCD